MPGQLTPKQSFGTGRLATAAESCLIASSSFGAIAAVPVFTTSAPSEPIDAVTFAGLVGDALEAAERIERRHGQPTEFELLTAMLFRWFADEGVTVALVEVGLGGRLDAVNAIDTDCAIITSIDLDHTELLGPDRESIGREKAGILREGKPAIVSDPVPPHSILQYAQALGADLWLLGRDFNFSGDKQQWAWAGRGRRYAGLAYPALRGANQLINASGVLAALGVEPERRVAVVMDRGPAWVVSLLAVWRAGGTYVPVDTACPGSGWRWCSVRRGPR